MDDKLSNDIEIAPPSVIKRSARDFAAALTETLQFKAFEQAADRLRQDEAAQHAMGAYQEKEIAWRALIMLNALSAEQNDELEDLRGAFINQSAVQEYFNRQAEFTTLCQALGDMLSKSIGLNYAAACGVSCCG